MAMDLEGGLTGRQPTRSVGEASWMVLAAGNQPMNKKEGTRLNLGGTRPEKEKHGKFSGGGGGVGVKNTWSEKKKWLQFSKEDGRVEVTA